MFLLNEASDVDSMSLSDGFKRAAVVQQPTHDERLHTSQALFSVASIMAAAVSRTLVSDGSKSTLFQPQFVSQTGIQDPDSSAQTMTLAFLSINHDAEKTSVLQQGDLENPAPPGPP
ncbi:uncharacterized protein V6R79_025164 [Siganus canaliculatus]